MDKTDLLLGFGYLCGGALIVPLVAVFDRGSAKELLWAYSLPCSGALIALILTIV